MRISDWSSDVCASDLEPRVAAVPVRIDRRIDRAPVAREAVEALADIGGLRQVDDGERVAIFAVDIIEVEVPAAAEARGREIQLRREADVGAQRLGRAAWWERVGEYV